MPGDRFTRRTFVRSSLAAGGGLMLGAALPRGAGAAPATVVAGPYGALGGFDANGIALPPGFTSRLIARGDQVVAGTGYTWHKQPDGSTTFPEIGGDGWYLVVNCEESGVTGGSSAIKFASNGTIQSAQRVLNGTTRNCAGGPTPWGTYLSCEEHNAGEVWEVDPTGAVAPVKRPLLGKFQHEAACVDPFGQHVYLTEDQPDGCFYRFVPTAYPDLSAGTLQVAKVAGDNSVTWHDVPAPTSIAPTPTRNQVPGVTRMNGGEGIWFDTLDKIVYFTTKGDRRVWMFHTTTSKLEILYDLSQAESDTPLRDVDNIVVSKSGDVFICEDGDNFEICMITPDRYISPFVRLDPTVHAGPGSNETTGVTFDPSGTRMYFNGQRSFNVGAVYEISGPFRLTRPAPGVTPPAKTVTPPPPTPTTTTPPPAPPAPPAPDLTKPNVRIRSLVRSRKVRTFLDRGLSVQFDIDEPAGIELILRAPGLGVLARTKTTVAVSGLVRLRLRVGAARLKRRLKRRRGKTLKTELTIRVTDRAGNVTTLKRTVRITVPRK